MKKKSKIMSLRELHLSRRIWWIDSFQTLRKWVEKDMNKKNYLKTIKVGTGRSNRYFFKSENIENYIRAFERGDF